MFLNVIVARRLRAVPINSIIIARSGMLAQMND
jgi:hypothetical protein